MMARYGPAEGGETQPLPLAADGSSNNRSQLQSEFSILLHTILNGTTPEEEYPSLFTQNIGMILDVISMDGGLRIEGMIQKFIQEDLQRGSYKNSINGGDDDVGEGNTISSTGDRMDQISEAVNLILSFAETFVEETKSMDDVYKRLLRTIFESIVPATANSQTTSPGSSSTSVNNVAASSSVSVTTMENQLDNLLSHEKEAFTPGFLRHIEGECERISSQKTISPETAKMLQIVRLVQTRVLEELGKGIGEAAIVLGQLLGYDDESERMAVLDAGLAVRGLGFAHELVALTEEALEGFIAVDDGVDPELVKSVEAMDKRIRSFIEKKEAFQ